EHVLFRQDDPGDSLYIIQSGQVRIVSNQTENAELVVNQFGPGDFFGELALVDYGLRSASAITVTPADLLLLKREHFLHMLAKHPLLSVEIIRGLSAKLRFAASYIEKAITWSQRIARGEYNSAMVAIEEERSAPAGGRIAQEVQIDPLIAAFFGMAEEVRRREEQLKSQLLSLRIEIDAAKKNRQVAEITETEHFRELQARARSMRGKISESPRE
ncbi:MAG: cyclic nucleotide-binding domain-containing protein, partial [Methylococcales bacterium]